MITDVLFLCVTGSFLVAGFIYLFIVFIYCWVQALRYDDSEQGLVAYSEIFKNNDSNLRVYDEYTK